MLKQDHCLTVSRKPITRLVKPNQWLANIIEETADKRRVCIPFLSCAFIRGMYILIYRLRDAPVCLAL